MKSQMDSPDRIKEPSSHDRREIPILNVKRGEYKLQSDKKSKQTSNEFESSADVVADGDLVSSEDQSAREHVKMLTG